MFLHPLFIVIIVALIPIGLSFVPSTPSSLPPKQEITTRIRLSSKATTFESNKKNGSRFILHSSSSSNNSNNKEDETNDNDEASNFRNRAEELRSQIRKLENELEESGKRRPQQESSSNNTTTNFDSKEEKISLRNKKILVIGANGRLGSMVCRYLLRSNPNTKVVAAVHYASETSTRGTGRLSYEIGAEDGVGTIGSAFSEERVATFQFTPEMASYNLQNIRLIDMELLDPIQCRTVTEDIDAIVWCATDFNGNKPRAISSLDIGLLFRSVSRPKKGRVEIEGLRNILGGLKDSLQKRKQQQQRGIGAVTLSPAKLLAPNDPISFVMISASPNAFLKDFETPFGTFNGLKREGEDILRKEFPSLSYTILRMSQYDDNFVEEGLDILMEDGGGGGQEDRQGFDEDDDHRKRKTLRRIHRRDAAKLAVDALVSSDWIGRTFDVWTVQRGGSSGINK